MSAERELIIKSIEDHRIHRNWTEDDVRKALNYAHIVFGNSAKDLLDQVWAASEAGQPFKFMSMDEIYDVIEDWIKNEEPPAKDVQEYIQSEIEGWFTIWNEIILRQSSELVG